MRVACRTIDGSYTNKKPVGYCVFVHHKGHITAKQYKVKQCGSCNYFRKNKEHPFWSQKRPIEQRKKRQYRKQKIFY